MIIPTGQSVIIFSTYRSGSTAICDYIATKYNLKNYDENLYGTPYLRNEFQETNDPYIIKVIVDQLNDESYNKFIQPIIESSYLIRLKRNDVFSQIISWYIANQTRNFHYTVDSPVNDYTVEINLDLLKQLGSTILNSNYLLSKLTCNIDQELIYENFGVIDSNFIPYHPPANKHDLIEALQYLCETDNDFKQYYNSITVEKFKQGVDRS